MLSVHQAVPAFSRIARCVYTAGIHRYASSSPQPPSQPPPPPPPPKSEAEQLLDAILPHVEKHGWSDAAIQAGIGDLGWSPAAAGLLPRGPASAIDMLVTRFNAELPKALVAADTVVSVKKEGGPGSSEDATGAEGEDARKEEAHARATRAIQTRIAMATPFRASWVQALQLQAQPPNVKYAALSSAKLADEVAHYAGYQRADFTWYTDRSVLAGAFHATEIFWLTDKSEGQKETWRFLSRGLRDAHNLREGAGSAAGKVANVADAALSTLSTIFRSRRKNY